MSDIAADTGTMNGSITTTPSINTTLQTTTTAELAIRAAFLAIFIIVGFVGNSILIATIAQSRHLRGAVMNLYIISIAVVNLIDSIVNMPLILGASISENWDYGDFACRLNASSVQLVSVVMIVGLMFMTLDRLVAVINVDVYETWMTTLLCNILIIYSWLHGFALTLPIVINVLHSVPYAARYLCSLGPRSNVIYIASVSVIGYLIPLLVILILYIIIIIRIAICAAGKGGTYGDSKERSTRSKGKNGFTPDPEEKEELQGINAQINATKYVGVLIILYCVFEGPFLLLTSIEQYKNSDQLSSIQEVSAVLDFKYPWQLDVSFTWLKLSYAIVLPIVTFLWRREVWIKFKNCICCNQRSKRAQKSSNNNGSATNSISSRKNKKELSNGDMSVPVLFAAEDGLQFQAARMEDGDSNEESDVFPAESDHASSASAMRGRKCDVLGSGFIQQQDHEDTSDYDSHSDVGEDGGVIDPFSNSIPVSIKSKESHASSKASDKKSHSYSSHSGNGKLKSLKEELSNAIEETKTKDKPPSKPRKKDKKLDNNDDQEKIVLDSENAESESVRTRNDSGNGSWEKQTGRKKQKNKKRLEQNNKNNNQTIEIENETINSHSVTDDIDYRHSSTKQEEAQPNVAENAEFDSEMIDDEKKIKKRKKKKKKKKGDEEDDVSQMTFDNDAYDFQPNNDIDTDANDTISIRKRSNSNNNISPTSGQPINSRKTVTASKADNEDSSDKLFKKVKGTRALPESPVNKKNKAQHRRRFSDDTDIVLTNQSRAGSKNNDRSPENLGSKTDRGPKRFLSHDNYLENRDDKQFSLEHNGTNNGGNSRPQPNPRKNKSRVSSSVDNSTFVVEKTHAKKGSSDSGMYNNDNDTTSEESQDSTPRNNGNGYTNLAVPESQQKNRKKKSSGTMT